MNNIIFLNKTKIQYKKTKEIPVLEEIKEDITNILPEGMDKSERSKLRIKMLNEMKYFKRLKE